MFSIFFPFHNQKRVFDSNMKKEKKKDKIKPNARSVNRILGGMLSFLTHS